MSITRVVVMNHSLCSNVTPPFSLSQKQCFRFLSATEQTTTFLVVVGFGVCDVDYPRSYEPFIVYPGSNVTPPFSFSQKECFRFLSATEQTTTFVVVAGSWYMRCRFPA